MKLTNLNINKMIKFLSTTQGRIFYPVCPLNPTHTKVFVLQMFKMVEETHTHKKSGFFKILRTKSFYPAFDIFLR